MKNNWTDEQNNAINARNISVIVSAAAGSGKTSVLVERILRIIADTENKIPANQMIIVTFTNDATAEMKQRLSAALNDMIHDDPENEWLLKQQALLQCARISTINAFCFDLIRENIQNTEISAGFRIIDETENKIIIQNCIEDTLEYAYASMPGKTDVLYRYFCGENDLMLENILKNINKFIESVPYGEKWLGKVISMLDDSRFTENIKKDFFEKLSAQFCNAAQKCKQALEIAESEGDMSDKACVKAISILENEYQYLSETADIFQNQPSLISERTGFSFVTLRVKNCFPQPAELKIKTLRDEYKKLYNSCISEEYSIFINADRDIKAHIEILQIISELLDILNQKINEVKISKNGLSFSDAEKIALELLSETDENGNIIKSELAKQLSDYYKVIMIDEFQDSNNKQNLIFRLLSHNGSADKNGDNMFLVGDVKQAIYGFRLSDSGIFTEVMENSVEYSENCSENAYIKLNMNFRSSAEVINFVNFIFTRIMSGNIGEVNYENEKLIQGAAFADTDKVTEIALIDDSDECENAAAVWTAAKIAEMLNNKAPVCCKDGVSSRPCENRDFCILLRNNDSAAAYADELRKLGIPSYLEQTSGYIRSREISLMINLLKTVDNPLRDTSLVSVMLSPMFSMSPDEVMEIRLLDRKASMYSALCMAVGEKFSGNDEKSEPLVNGVCLEKARNIYSIINELRMYSASDTLEQLIRRIYERTDFLSVMQIYSDSEKKKANLRILIEHAKSYEKSSCGGLSGFLRFIEKSSSLGNDGFKNGSTSSGSENVVSIKTMHKSKGLEFPFVFAGNLEKKFNTMDITNSVIMDYEYGIGFILRNPELLTLYSTIIHRYIGKIKKSKLLSEESRLLYVALTRAKDKIFIPVKINKEFKDKLILMAEKVTAENGISADLAGSANSMLDWIMMSLVCSEHSQPLRDICGIKNSAVFPDNLEIRYTPADISIPEVVLSENIPGKTDLPADKDKVSDIEKSFEFFENGYDFRFSKLPAKLSVSDIVSENRISSERLRRPQFIKNTQALTGSEIGTALHTFMQYADFKNLAANPDNELDICVSKGFITQKEREHIKIQKIKRFTDSALFRRIQKSQSVKRERRFMISLEDINADGMIKPEYCGQDIILQGIADLTFEENNKIILVDYKTDYVSSEEKLADEYRNQLELYKRAFEKIDGKPVSECIIYSFSLGKCIFI